jgi:hypothetical protein
MAALPQSPRNWRNSGAIRTKPQKSPDAAQGDRELKTWEIAIAPKTATTAPNKIAIERLRIRLPPAFLIPGFVFMLQFSVPVPHPSLM